MARSKNQTPVTSLTYAIVIDAETARPKIVSKLGKTSFPTSRLRSMVTEAREASDPMAALASFATVKENRNLSSFLAAVIQGGTSFQALDFHCQLAPDSEKVGLQALLSLTPAQAEELNTLRAEFLGAKQSKPKKARVTMASIIASQNANI
jgi:hypothetical protein